jgi:hypothetical protein
MNKQNNDEYSENEEDNNEDYKEEENFNLA